MIKKILLLLAILIFSTCVYAADPIKINSINFDNSDAVIYLGTSSKDIGVKLNIETKKLSNPDRVYFDIKDSVLTQSKSSWLFKNGGLISAKISQFSTTPMITRLVLIPSSTVKLDDIKVYSLNNNIIIKYKKNSLASKDYAYNIYREQRTSPDDFCAKSSFYQEVPQAPKNDVSSQINKAFAVSTDEEYVKPLKLRSRVYINQVQVKRGNILISGMGNFATEKPMVLVEPKRIVYDFQNAVLEPSLKNQEYIVGESEYLRIAQFEPNKVRVVLKTPHPEKYRPVYAASLQGVLLAHDDRMAGIKLSNKIANLTGINFPKSSETETKIDFNFTSAIVYSIKRESENIQFRIYNAGGYYENEVRKVFRAADLGETKVERLPQGGLSFIIPVSKSAIVDSFISSDARRLRVRIKNYTVTKKVINNNVKGEIIIIDPGHGGADVGATRSGVNEKDINLDVSQRVASILRSKGAKVELTRSDDKTLSLQDRVDISENKNAKLFVSIHVNSCVKSEITGIETHYYKDNSYELAKITHNALAKSVNSPDRGIFQSKFYVINHTTAPAILVEIGFLSNDNERDDLLTEDRKQKTAKAIANGIMMYLSQQKGK